MPVSVFSVIASLRVCKVAALVGLGSLTACVSAEDRASNETKAAATRQEAGLREPFVKDMSTDEAKAFFVGKTRVVSAGNRGSQVSYMDSDGSVYLWFPGNPTVLRGRWSFSEKSRYQAYAGQYVSAASVCFDYGPNSVNAFSGDRGGVSCVPGAALATLSYERADGDVFGLSRKTEVPFVLPPERTTIAALRKRGSV